MMALDCVDHRLMLPDADGISVLNAQGTAPNSRSHRHHRARTVEKAVEAMRLGATISLKSHWTAPPC